MTIDAQLFAAFAIRSVSSSVIDLIDWHRTGSHVGGGRLNSESAATGFGSPGSSGAESEAEADQELEANTAGVREPGADHNPAGTVSAFGRGTPSISSWPEQLPASRRRARTAAVDAGRTIVLGARGCATVRGVVPATLVRKRNAEDEVISFTK